MIFQPQVAKRTRELLAKRPRSVTILTIAEATGLTAAWINDFAAYPDRDHGINKVETLYVYLSGENLLNDDCSE